MKNLKAVYMALSNEFPKLAPNNEQPGSSPTKGEILERPCDGLVICHNPALTLTLTFAYTACGIKLSL